MHLCSWKVSGSFQTAISVLFTKSQNTNIHTFKDNMRSQYLLQIKIYITGSLRSFRWHIQVLFTGRQMRLKSQDCYNPLMELVKVLRCCSGFFPGLFGFCVLFRGDGSCLHKDACGCRFSPVFPYSIPSSF